jgi:hypothetical protein
MLNEIEAEAINTRTTIDITKDEVYLEKSGLKTPSL